MSEEKVEEELSGEDIDKKIAETAINVSCDEEILDESEYEVCVPWIRPNDGIEACQAAIEQIQGILERNSLVPEEEE